MTFEEFRHLAGTYNVIPVCQTLLADMLTPVSAYLRLRTLSGNSFLFESVEGGERLARYSFIGNDAHILIRSRGMRVTVTENGTPKPAGSDLFAVIGETLERYHQAPVAQLPRFAGGLVGSIGYDAVRFIEHIPESAGSETDDSILGLFTSLLAFDHLKHQITIVQNVIVNPAEDLHAQYAKALEMIRQTERRLLGDGAVTLRPLTAGPIHAETYGFSSIVEQAKRHIVDGDIFQVVLSQRFRADYDGDLFHVYRALRVLNPSPYLYYLEFGETRIIGSSPEVLVRMEGAMAEVYPIAGTRRRGETPDEDRLLEAELLSDPKERAEHIMLVDLGRNDLGRVCVSGSVRVEELMAVVRYSHVMHLASRVTGTIAPGKSRLDVLKATFPAGTVSGAPKIRAMEIIDALERSRRGVYAGGVGYFDFSRTMDLCIAIRTLFADRSRLYFQAGAGIVADSDPEREEQETVNKSKVLVDALAMAQELSRAEAAHA